MYYSVTFTRDDGQKKNTWEDWHLIPTTPPMVIPPEPDFNFVEIPGRKKGPLDITGVLNNGETTFKNSEGSWDFVRADDEMERPALKREIRKFLHGGRMKVQFEEDPDYYWQGRFTVGETTTGKNATAITLEYIIEPTEYEASSSAADIDSLLP